MFFNFSIKLKGIKSLIELCINCSYVLNVNHSDTSQHIDSKAESCSWLQKKYEEIYEPGDRLLFKNSSRWYGIQWLLIQRNALLTCNKHSASQPPSAVPNSCSSGWTAGRNLGISDIFAIADNGQLLYIISFLTTINILI